MAAKKKPCPDCKKHKAEIRRLRRILKKIKDECADTPMLMGFAIDLADEGLRASTKTGKKTRGRR